MKAIIPVAGAGTKLRPHTYTQPKALIPLAGKTILSIIIDQLADAGIKDIILVVGYLGNKIQDHAKAHYPHLNITIIQQHERKGLGHAVYLCKEAVDNDEVVIVLGDTICEYNATEFLATEGSVLGVKKVDDPRDFGVAETDESGNVSRVIEKPQIPRTNNALVGIYKIKDSSMLFDCLSRVMSNTTQEGEEHGLVHMGGDGGGRCGCPLVIRCLGNVVVLAVCLPDRHRGHGPGIAPPGRWLAQG